MVDGDLLEQASLERALDGVRQVVHLAALVRSTDPPANHAVNTEGTLNLLRAASDAGVERIVGLSSDSVLRSQRSPYAESKAAGEKALLAWGQQPKRSALVLRPPLILGPESKHLSSFAKLSRLPFLPLPKDGASRCPVHVDDVVAALLNALEVNDERVPPTAIDLPGATRLSFGELIGAVAQAQGRTGPRVRLLPRAAMRQIARIGGARATEQLEGMTEEVTLDGALAREILQWAPLPIGELLARSL